MIGIDNGLAGVLQDLMILSSRACWNFVNCTWACANGLRSPPTLPEDKALLQQPFIGNGQAHLVVVKERLALHELVVLVDAAVEEMADGGVVGQHEAAHAMCSGQIWRFLGQRHLHRMTKPSLVMCGDSLDSKTSKRMFILLISTCQMKNRRLLLDCNRDEAPESKESTWHVL